MKKEKSLYILTMIIFGYINCTGQSCVYDSVAESLQNSMHNLFYNASGHYYNQDNCGNTGFNYWWNAHAIDAFMDGYLRTRDTHYLIRSINLLRGIKSKNRNTFNNSFYDDMEWLGISSLRAYSITKDQEYLDAALYLWEKTKKGYSSPGVVSWNSSCHPTCKNACSNNPAVILGARLYRIGQIGEEDLEIIKTIFSNVKIFMVNHQTGAVWDSYNFTTGSPNYATYSYNQGTYIGAAWELYKITGDQTYIDDAIKTADYAISNNTDGILYPEAGGGDGGLFNGILVRYLALFAREANISQTQKEKYNNMILSSAQVLCNQGINESKMIVNSKWGIPPGNCTDFSSQLSGVMLIEAAATMDKVALYQDNNYDGYSSWFGIGDYTLSQLQDNGALDNDISSITIPYGLQVTLYDEDNFTGETIVITSNLTLFGDWSDKLTSLSVEKIEHKAASKLFYNSPNPFGPSTTINFSVPVESSVSMKIYNLRGQCVKNLFNDVVGPGLYSVVWNGTDNNGYGISSGNYICELTSDNYSGSIKLLLIR